MTVGQERALLARLLRESVLTLCRETMASHRRLVVDGIVLVSLEDDDEDEDTGDDRPEESEGEAAGVGGEGPGGVRSGRRSSGDDNKSPVVVTIHEQLPKVGESRSSSNGSWGVGPGIDTTSLLRTMLRARKRSCPRGADECSGLPNRSKYCNRNSHHPTSRGLAPPDVPLELTCRRNTANSTANTININNSSRSNVSESRNREVELLEEEEEEGEVEVKRMELNSTLPASQRSHILRIASQTECRPAGMANPTPPQPRLHSPPAPCPVDRDRPTPTLSASSASPPSSSFHPVPPRRCSSERPPPCKLQRWDGDEQLEDGRRSDPGPLNLATHGRSSTSTSDADHHSSRNTTADSRAWTSDDAVDLSRLWRSCSISSTANDDSSSGGGSNRSSIDSNGTVSVWRPKERAGASKESAGARKAGLRCTRCGLRAANVLSLERHNLREHACFTCHVCLTTFTARNNLKRHARVHTGHRPYECLTCHAAFFRRDDLKTHCQRHINKNNTSSNNNNNRNNGFDAVVAPVEISRHKANGGKHNNSTRLPHLHPYGCKRCGKVFLHPRFLRWHLANQPCRQKPDTGGLTEQGEPIINVVEDEEEEVAGVVVPGGGGGSGSEAQDGDLSCPKQQSSWCTECQRGFPDEDALIQHITHTHENGRMGDRRESRPPGADLSEGISGRVNNNHNEDTPMENVEKNTRDGSGNTTEGKSADRNPSGQQQAHPSPTQREESNSSSNRREEVPKGPSMRPCEEQADLVIDEDSRWISLDASSGAASDLTGRWSSASQPLPRTSSHSPDASRLREILSASPRTFHEASSSTQPSDRPVTPPSFIELVRPNDFFIDHNGTETPRSPSPSPSPAGGPLNSYASRSWQIRTPQSSSGANSPPGDGPPMAHSVGRGGSAVPRFVDNFLHVETSDLPRSPFIASDGSRCVKLEPMSDADDQAEEGEAVPARRMYQSRDSSAARGGGACYPGSHGQSCVDCCPPFSSSFVPPAMTSISPRSGPALGFAPPPLSPNLPTDLSMNRSSPSGPSSRSGRHSSVGIISGIHHSNTNAPTSTPASAGMTTTSAKPISFEKVVTPEVLYKERSPFRCAVKECAELQFATFTQLEEHSARLHRRFLCEYCGNSFTAKPNRDRHVRYHTGDRPYKCSLCPQAFFRGDDLKYHRTTKHTGVTLHEQGLL